MKNTTFIMGIALTLLILVLSLGTQEAEAANMDDVTLQVLETNDPSEIINNIELPEISNEHQPDKAHDDSHKAAHEVDDKVQDVHDEIEDDIDDARDDIEDSIEEVEEENENPEGPED